MKERVQRFSRRFIRYRSTRNHPITNGSGHCETEKLVQTIRHQLPLKKAEQSDQRKIKKNVELLVSLRMYNWNVNKIPAQSMQRPTGKRWNSNNKRTQQAGRQAGAGNPYSLACISWCIGRRRPKQNGMPAAALPQKEEVNWLFLIRNVWSLSEI